MSSKKSKKRGDRGASRSETPIETSVEAASDACRAYETVFVDLDGYYGESIIKVVIRVTLLSIPPPPTNSHAQ